MLKDALMPKKVRLFGSPIKSVSDGWFELLLVTIVLAVTLVAHGVLNATHVVVHFYYLPVIIAAHYFGRNLACTIALFSVLTVSAFMLLSPQHYKTAISSPIVAIMTIIAWGGFLGLNALLMGSLSNQRAQTMSELREAHVGIIEILSKYLNAADQYTKSHSIRVAELSTAIAEEMHLKDNIVEDVRVGALLHDIGKVEISTRLIKKAAELNAEERDEMDAHTVRGADLVRSLGTILDGAIPVIKHHHDHYSEESKQQGLHGEDIPIGARIVSVADAYDAIVTDRPYRRGRTPEEAVTIIRGASGTQFDPKVVTAFEAVVSRRNEDVDSSSGGNVDRPLSVSAVEH